MKPNRSKTLTYLIFLLIGVVLLWLCFRKIAFRELVDYFSTANYWWMGASLIFLAVSLFFRALRWNLLLNTLGYQTRESTTYASVLIAYLANYVFPRLGEITRCATLTKKENIPFDKSFGTVVSERIVDILFLLVMAVIVVVAQWEMLGATVISWLRPLGDLFFGNSTRLVLFLAFLSCFLGLGIFFFKKYKSTMKKMPLLVKIHSLWQGFLAGINTIFTMQRKWTFLFHTFMIWGLYVVMTWLPFYMLQETSSLGVTEALTLLAISTFGFVAPVQGGIGTYHWIGILLLTQFYNISNTAATAFVTINHTSQTVFYLLAGGISYLLIFVIDRRKPLND